MIFASREVFILPWGHLLFVETLNKPKNLGKEYVWNRMGYPTTDFELGIWNWAWKLHSILVGYIQWRIIGVKNPIRNLRLKWSAGSEMVLPLSLSIIFRNAQPPVELPGDD